MKTSKLLGITFIIVLFLSSCSGGKMTEPEDVGKNVFNILIGLSTKTKEEYFKNFPSVEELREIAKNEKAVSDERGRNELTTMLKEEWNKKILDDYNYSKESAAEYGIDWSKIEYLDFIYEEEERRGIKGSVGRLFFKYSDKTYLVKTKALWTGSEFKIIEIDGTYRR